jgi:hypothetical protein
MIFVTAFPPESKHMERYITRLARLASDARVSVSTIQTGGNSVPFGPTARSFGELQAIEDVRALARTTGGTISVYDDAVDAVRRIEQRTGFQYVLGYYPSSSPEDRRFHSIEVKISRPDVDLSYRRGYFANAISRADARAVVSRERVDAALEDPRVYADVVFTLAARRDGSRVDIEMKIDPATVDFVEKGSRRCAYFDIAVVAGSGNAALPGSKRDVVDLEFEPQAFARLAKEKIAYKTSMELTGSPGDPKALSVKAVVYDYTADRIGTAVVRIK